MDERTLVEQLKKGDEAAFKTIVETWQNMVYNTALGIVQNAQDAEDIAQETFVQVYHSVGSFKGESKFSTWLYRITIAKALDHERRKKRKKRFAFVKSLFGEDSEVVVHPPDFNHPGVELDKKETAATPQSQPYFCKFSLKNLDLIFTCASDRDRTCDLCLMKTPLYH